MARVRLRSAAMVVVMAAVIVVGIVAAEAAAPSAASAQGATALFNDEVTYPNPLDGTRLSARLTLPAGVGAHPAVVVLSVAGTAPLVERLVADGYAVLEPVRRGFTDVEPLLRATYDDLAGDVAAALTYLRSRDDIDGAALGLIAQSDDGPPAMLAASVEADESTAFAGSVPLVLLAPPTLSGVESFRVEQRALAERDGMRPDEVRAVDDYVGAIAEIVLGNGEAYAREFRLERLRDESSVELPRNAAFPVGDLQAHFFASPLWRDRLGFAPEESLADLVSPTIVLIGLGDPNTPIEAYLEAARRGLEGSLSRDATVCAIEGRTRHTFTADAVETIATWLEDRVGSGSSPQSGDRAASGGAVPDRGGLPSACVEGTVVRPD